MVQKGYVLIGILLLGLFMFISTLWTLENYNLQEQQRQGSKFQTYFTNSFHSSFNSSSPTSAQSKYFSFPSFENETLWNFETNPFDHLFENASETFANLHLWGDEENPLALNSSSPSSLQLPYLSYVQNRTSRFWKSVGNQINQINLFHFSKLNTTAPVNSSAFESQLVDLFVSKYLRGEVAEEEPSAAITGSGLLLIFFTKQTP
jgi:hypothetical protein